MILNFKILFFAFIIFNQYHKEQTLIPEERVQYICNYNVKKPSGFHQANSETFVLLIGEFHTLFLGETKMKYDSLRKKTDNINLLLGVAPSRVNTSTLSKEIILVSRIKNQITVTDEPLYETLYYNEEIKHNWVIKNEYKKINGWQCQQAEITYSGRTYKVWFTREIPLPVGPYKFFGLPGLIIHISDSNCLFNFELTSISKVDYSKQIEFNTNGAIKSTKKGIQDAYIKFASNPLFAIESRGKTISFDNEEMRSNMSKPIPPPIFIEILD